MQINWCFKGIAESSAFDDKTAIAVLSETGILSSWVVANSSTQLNRANSSSQDALNPRALDYHVNSYGAVRGSTPYISLSAGCNEYRGRFAAPRTYPALRTALDFATDGGRRPGYVFRCWVITGLKPAPELPGFAEEVRDINLFASFYRYHFEGEVTAKLVVPRRQVQWVLKVKSNARPMRASWSPAGGKWVRAYRNPDFVAPSRVSNVISAL
jgi:hypothetical protein